MAQGLPDDELQGLYNLWHKASQISQIIDGKSLTDGTMASQMAQGLTDLF